MTTETQADRGDIVSRYLYSRQDFTSERVRFNAFIPPRSYPNEISVYKINNPDLLQEEIWELADKFGRADRPCVARADLKVCDIVSIDVDESGRKLSVLLNGIPHPRHANIKPFPSDKARAKAIALELEKKAGKPIERSSTPSTKP